MRNLDRSQVLAAIVVGVCLVGGAFWLAGVIVLDKGLEDLGEVGITTWAQFFYHNFDDPIARGRLLEALAKSLGGVLVVGVLAAVALRPKEALHGAARFARLAEIKAAGLIGREGILLGKLGRHFLTLAGNLSVILTAPPGSGKGVGIVIPNLFAWLSSAVVLDVKIENFFRTSLFRQKVLKQKVYLFAPFDQEGRTHRYNPLGFLSDDPRIRLAEINDIATAWYPARGGDPIWQETARNLFVGIALYVYETPGLPTTFGEVLRQGSGKGRPIREHVQGVIRERNYIKVEGARDDHGNPIDEWRPRTSADPEPALPMLSVDCVNVLNVFLGAEGKTSSSIYTTFAAPLAMWQNPLIDAATSASDFDLSRVRKERMTIYVGITPDKLPQAESLLNLFFAQLIGLNTRQQLRETPEIKYPCLVLLDEALSLGYVPIFEKAISYVRGYGLRFLTVFQSEGQMRAAPPRGYGEQSARDIVTSHGARIMYPPRETRDAEEYSKALGDRTVSTRSMRLGTIHDGTESQAKRPLMLPQEIKAMPRDEQLISLDMELPPIRCKRIKYYAEKRFVNCMKSVSPSLAAIGRRFPTEAEIEAAVAARELSIDLPRIDFDLYDAISKQCIRPMTMDDVGKGFAIDHVAAPIRTPEAPPEGISPELAESMSEDFIADLLLAQASRLGAATKPGDADGGGRDPTIPPGAPPGVDPNTGEDLRPPRTRRSVSVLDQTQPA